MGKISAFYAMPHPPILIPEIGRGEEEKIKATGEACKKVAKDIASLKPDTIIIITPHGPLFSDAVAISSGPRIDGNLGQFGAPSVKLSLEIDQALVDKIVTYAEEEDLVMARITKDSAKKYGAQYQLDHGSIVPLYFVNKEFSNYKIVHITYGMLPKVQLYKLGTVIQKAVKDSSSQAVFIASGDLSHKLSETGPYEYSPYGERFDKELIDLLQKGDVKGVFNMDPALVEGAGECGLRSFYMMLGAMDGHSIKGNLLSYEGTFGVGYGVMEFSLEESLQENQSPYVKLARESLMHYLKTGEYLDASPHITREMTESKRGVFVSLKKEGNLRGCIGTIFPVTENLGQEIIRNAVEAGIYDPRFAPVEASELKDLDFSVDVLTEPQITSKDELDPKKYGVIVRSGRKIGLLLPNLEGVDSVEEQLDISLQKAGIGPDEAYTIEKFEVVRYF